MADGVIRRFIRVIFDRTSAKQAGDQLSTAMAGAGKKSGDNFVRELKSSFNKEMASLKQQLAKGLIDEKEFKKRGDVAAKNFNAGLIKGMEDARRAGKLTDAEFIKLGNTLKRTGVEGVSAGRLIQSAFARLGATLVATFGIQAGIRFFTNSIEAALEAERSIQRLDSALKPLGLSYKRVGVQAEAYLNRLQETTRFSDEDAREALTALVTGTGDYDKSLRLLDVSAKIAEKRQISMADAAQVAIKLSQGLTKGMLDLGIGAGETGDLIKKVSDNLGDLAVEAGRTNEGVLKRAANLWDEFQENIGLAVLGSEAWQSGSDGLIKTLVDMNKWVQENNKSIGEAANSIAQLIVWLTKLSVGVVRYLSDPIGFLETAWGRAGDKPARQTHEPAKGEMGILFPNEPGKATRGTPTPKGAKEGADKLAAEREKIAHELRVKLLMVEEQITKDLAEEMVRRSELLGTAAPQQFATLEEGWQKLAGLNTILAAGMTNDLQPAIKQTEQVMLTATDNMGAALDKLSQKNEEARSGWSQGMAVLSNELEKNQDLVWALADSWAEGNLLGLASYALGKVKENLAKVIEETALAFGSFALGNPAAGAAHLKSAATHGAAALAWKTLAKGAGGGGSSSAGGAAGGGGGSNLTQAGGMQRAEQEVNIYLTGPGWNALNPEVQKVVYGAQQQARERYGENTKIRIRRAP